MSSPEPTTNDPPAEAAHPAGGISTRAVEIVVAAVLLALGALVVFDSRRLGSTWGSDGPEAGYFPFYIGLIICLSSLAILVQAIRDRHGSGRRVFVAWQPLRQVLSMLLPAVLFVLAIQVIGLYVAAAVYIAGFMLWLGNYSLAEERSARRDRECDRVRHVRDLVPGPAVQGRVRSVGVSRLLKHVLL